MKNIGIDARLIFQTGVGTYIQNLLHYLPAYAPKHITFTIFCLSQDAEFIKAEVPNCTIHTTTALWHSWEEQTQFLHCILEEKLDLMHFTYFGHPILYKGSYISTVHDITPLIYKTGRASTRNPLIYALKHEVFSYVLKNQVMRSRAIITPTQTVREQLIQLYGDHIHTKITAIYEGVSYRLLGASKGVNSINNPYYLYVGNFYPHKNVQFLIQSFAKCESTRSLVLAGPRDYFLQRILNSLTEEERMRIIIKDKQSLGDLSALYQNADALIHPSVSEGFGLPVVEALQFNLPVIASQIPVFQELLGTSYYSFDPYSESSLIRAIQTFERDSQKKKNILNSEFSFEQMTKKTMDLYVKNG